MNIWNQVSAFLASIWTDYKGEIVVVVISVILTAIVNYLFTPRPLRQRWRHQSKVKRLEDRLIHLERVGSEPLKWISLYLQLFLLQVAWYNLVTIGFCLYFVFNQPDNASDLIPVIGAIAGGLVYACVIAANRIKFFTNPQRYKKRLHHKINLLKERGY